MNLEYIKDKFEKAKLAKQEWNNEFVENYAYFLPQRIKKRVKSQNGQNIFVGDYDYEYGMESLIDNTGPSALESYANQIESDIIPADAPWYQFIPGSTIPEDQKNEVELDLEKLNNYIFKQISNSNFYAEIHKSFLDLGISTGIIIVEPADNLTQLTTQTALNFRAVSLLDAYICESSRLEKDVIIEKYMSEEEKEEIGILKDDSVYEGVFLIKNNNIKREEDIRYNLVTFTDTKIISKVETTYNPYIIFNTSNMLDSAYAVGRAMLALSTNVELQRLHYQKLKNLEYYVTPMFTNVSGGQINVKNQKVKPGAIFNVQEKDGFKPIQMGGNPEILQEEIEGCRQEINRIMFTNPFGDIESTSVRSASEINRRKEEQLKNTFSHNNKIQQTLIIPLLKKVLHILRKKKIIPTDVKLDGKFMDLIVKDPNNTLKNERAFNQLNRGIQALSLLPMDVLQGEINFAKLPKQVFEMLDISKDLLLTEEEKTARKQEIQQQQQAQQMQIQQQQQAQQLANTQQAQQINQQAKLNGGQ